MAIPRISSKELMDVLESSEENMTGLRNNINTIRTELNNKLAVFSNAMEFVSSSIGSINEYILQKQSVDITTIIPAEMEAEAGKFVSFGSCVHPAYTSLPTNVFNFMSATGPIFKNNANIYIDGENAVEHLPMLMHDAIKGKGTAFSEFEEQDITLRIEINPNDLYGATTANTIELLPYIPGSFDIKQIRLFSMQDFRTKSSVASVIINNTMPRVGTERIILPKTIDVYACEIDIHLLFKNSAGKYPFGFKHLYFLNANYNQNSHILLKLRRDKYIDWISDDIVVHDQYGVRDTTCTEEGIEIYAAYSNGNLGYEVTPTRGIQQNTIAKNVKELYIAIPLTVSLKSIKFKEIGER